MATVIHGDNIIQSRELLVTSIAKAKLSGIEIVTLNGRKITPTLVHQALESGSLFGATRLVIIEDLHKNLSKTHTKEIYTYLSSLSPQTTELIIYASNQLTVSQLKPFASWKIHHCKTSAAIFAFTDALIPKGQAQFLPLFYRACRQDSVEFVLVMLSRQVRLLFQAHDPNFKTAPFILSKLQKQRQNWTDSQLVSFHDSLLDLDFANKSGNIVGNLESNLAYLLSKI